MDLIQLGKNISEVRRKRNLTQEDVAFDLNISINAYSRIERGETNVSFNRLLQIAALLKIEISDLVQEKTIPSKIERMAVDIEQIKTDIHLIQRSLITI